MKKTLIWILAIFITLGSAYYQRKTGPTYPKRITTNLAGNELKLKLIRSGITGVDCKIEIPVKSDSISGKLFYKRFPANESFKEIIFLKEDDKLIGILPFQPPAGKLEYYVSLMEKDQKFLSEHVIIRFKDSVPSWALIPHVLLMFIAMLLSNLAGLLASFKIEKHVLYGNIAFILLLLGGMLFGPIVQHYAFGQAWTGIPLGWDLTDNKTLIAVLFWLVAVLGNRKNPKFRNTIIASVILFLIYIIPHSLFGSELDYSSGKVVTGIINLFF